MADDWRLCHLADGGFSPVSGAPDATVGGNDDAIAWRGGSQPATLRIDLAQGTLGAGVTSITVRLDPSGGVPLAAPVLQYTGPREKEAFP
jgi:hypothetical protein